MLCITETKESLKTGSGNAFFFWFGGSLRAEMSENVTCTN